MIKGFFEFKCSKEQKKDPGVYIFPVIKRSFDHECRHRKMKLPSRKYKVWIGIFEKNITLVGGPLVR
jgi:hypothetical protein